MPITNDLRRVSVAPLPAPAVGEYVEDPSFGGTRIWRVTDAAAEGLAGEGVAPMYTGTQAWNADETLMILHAPKEGWRLYSGQPPFRFLAPMRFPEPPSSPEFVHWSTSEPYVLRWLGHLGGVWRTDLLGKTTEKVYQIPKAPNQNVLMEAHVRPSWDDRVWGFGTWTDDTRGNKRLIVVDLEAGEELVNIGYQDIGGDPRAKGTLGIPMISPDGERFIVYVAGFFYVLGLRPLRLLREIPADYTFEHQTLGKLAVPELGWETDVYYSKSQGKNPIASQVCYLLTCNLEAGYFRPDLGREITTHKVDLPYVKIDGAFPYQFPAGVHLTAISYRDPNWVWMSMMPPAMSEHMGYVYAGQELECFQQEIWRVNLITKTVERMAHHRSAHQINPAYGFQNPYWQEPHPCVSPSGRFCVFGSDWSFDLPDDKRGTKVDSWVIDTAPDTAAVQEAEE